MFFESFCRAVPSQVTSNTSAMVVKKGDSVSLFCQAVGIPAPAIEWFHEIEQVSETNEWTTESVAGRIITLSEVRTVNVDVSDAGKYMCKASNKGGQSNTTISLDVQCESFEYRHTVQQMRFGELLLTVCFSFSCLCGCSI